MMTVNLSGYPEAVLGRSAMDIALPRDAIVADAVTAIAEQDSNLREALLHPDSCPRRSTKALINGSVASLTTPIPTDSSITVLAALPCDG